MQYNILVSCFHFDNSLTLSKTLVTQRILNIAVFLGRLKNFLFFLNSSAKPSFFRLEFLSKFCRSYSSAKSIFSLWQPWFYLWDSFQTQTWLLFYNKQASYRISSKLIKNFLSYLDHRVTNKITESQPYSWRSGAYDPRGRAARLISCPPPWGAGFSTSSIPPTLW